RDGCRIQGLQRGVAAPRRLRLHQGIPDRALSARPPGSPDSRRYQRNHACDHRPPAPRRAEEPALTDELLIERRGAVGLVTLNRPKALNALTLSMLHRLDPLLAEWEEDPGIAAIVVRGAGGKAFCAGGDVRAIAESGPGLGGPDDLKRVFFRDEYRVIRRIHRLKTPYVALQNGITMGGGAGISINGRYRVCTDSTLFAMPET